MADYTSATEEEILERLKKVFAETFGEGEIRLFFAPGRVNMIGEHTDYNGGHVFPCAISLGTYAAARARDDKKIRFASLNKKGDIREAELGDIVYKEEDSWANYPKGVAWAFEEAGHVIPAGFDMLIFGNIPAGSGLSSSASLEVLTALVIRELFGLDVPQAELAILGQKAENVFVGMNCGIMDQFASAMGQKDHAIFLDAATLNYEYAPLILGHAKIVITNSNVKHELASSEYNTRRRECEEAVAQISAEKPIETLGQLDGAEYEAVKHLITDPVVEKRARHAVYENIRTKDAVKALDGGDVAEFGRLMNASHDSLRDDYAVSCPEIDYLVDEARKIPGVIGSRITGGGFGGCTVSIVEDASVETFCETLKKNYKEHCGLDAEFYIVIPSEGAHELK